MAFELAIVTAFIKGLSVTATLPSGSTQHLIIRDYGDVRDGADQRAGPVLQPDVTRAVTLQTVVRDSYGSGMSARQTIRYSLPYVLLYAPVGQVTQPTIANIWPGMAATVKAIVTAVLANDNPSAGGSTVDLFVESATLGQAVNTPGGDPHHGAWLNFGVIELVN